MIKYIIFRVQIKISKQKMVDFQNYYFLLCFEYQHKKFANMYTEFYCGYKKKLGILYKRYIH